MQSPDGRSFTPLFGHGPCSCEMGVSGTTCTGLPHCKPPCGRLARRAVREECCQARLCIPTENQDQQDLKRTSSDRPTDVTRARLLQARALRAPCCMPTQAYGFSVLHTFSWKARKHSASRPQERPRSLSYLQSLQMGFRNCLARNPRQRWVAAVPNHGCVLGHACLAHDEPRPEWPGACTILILEPPSIINTPASGTTDTTTDTACSAKACP